MSMQRAFLLFPLFLLSLASGAAPAEATLYVSTAGDDGWSGTLAAPSADRSDGPLRTPAAARDAVRRLRSQQPNQPTTVLVRGGVYTLSEPLAFSPEDSGAPQAPVIYAGYPGETPILSGGRRIVGWKRSSKDEGLWTAEIPDAKSGKWYFHQLFVDGRRRQRAKSPNTDFFYVDGRISPDRNAQFRYHEGDIRPEWARQQGVEVVALCKWQQYRIPIASVDAAAQTATLAGARMPNGADVNPRYWVENTLDALDAPGEWFLERETGILYYRPMPDEDLNTAETVAPFLERLVEFAGDAKAGRYVHDITLRGFALCHTDWSLGPSGYSDMQAASEIPAAIDLRGARSCAIENCVLSHLGQYAVGVGMGSKENRVAANEMTDLGAGGVKIGDAQCNAHPMRGPSDAPTEQGGPNGREGANYPQSDQETTSGNVVSDNDIHDIGAVFASAVGVWIGQSYGNTVAHNEIHDTYYSGISLGWTWGWGRTAAHDNLIEQNHIHHIGRGLLCDMGCIYTLGFQPGTALRNNLCHDVERYEKKPAGFQADSTTPEGLVENQTGYGGWGLYLDSASSRILVENNVVYNTQDGAYHNQYGQENTVRNNIFALGTRAQLTRHYRGAKKPSFFFDHNIIYWKTGLLQWGMWGDGLYEMDHNLYFRADGQPIEFGKLSFEQWQAERGQDKNSRIADPMFVDPDHGDFTLKPGSPALQLGFQPIDLSHVGPRQKAGIPSGGGR